MWKYSNTTIWDKKYYVTTILTSGASKPYIQVLGFPLQRQYRLITRRVIHAQARGCICIVFVQSLRVWRSNYTHSILGSMFHPMEYLWLEITYASTSVLAHTFSYVFRTSMNNMCFVLLRNASSRVLQNISMSRENKYAISKPSRWDNLFHDNLAIYGVQGLLGPLSLTWFKFNPSMDK